VLKISWFRNPEQPGDQFCKVFGAASCFSTRCPVDSTRVLVCYRFYILRFLLICQSESLDLTFTLKWFFLFEKFQNTVPEQLWEQGVQSVFKPKWFFNVFPKILGWWFWKYLDIFSAIIKSKISYFWHWNMLWRSLA